MTARVFVDTNVLIYSKDSRAKGKQIKAFHWMNYLWNSRLGRLSIQVLNEFYVAVTLKLKPGLSKKEAREEIRTLMAWNPVAQDEALVIRSWEIQDRYSISFWDSMIIAAAEFQSCKNILTEDLQDGQNFGGIVIVNPFQHLPDSTEDQ